MYTSCNNNKVLIICLILLFLSANGKAQIYHPQQNLIVNSDFIARDMQQRPLDWIIGIGLQTAIISGAQKHGSRPDDLSLKLADTSTSQSVLIRSKKIAAHPNSFYVAKAWLKTESGTPGNLTIEFWDQNNAIIASKLITDETSPDWQELIMKIKSPDKCTHVTLSISTTMTARGVSYWDDVSLVEEVVEQLFVKKGVRELFMDDYRVEQMIDVQRVVNPGAKSKILIQPTEPWEGNATYIYGTVLKNEPAGSGYRMWYSTYLKEKYYLCYATSKDGIHWHKPKLGVIEFEGSKENNICKEGGGTVVYDPLTKDPAQRYKLMTFISAKEQYGYNVFFSADGLNWKHMHNKAVLPYGDVSNIAYDKDNGLFIATTKQRMVISNTSVTPNKNDRIAFVSVSKDFVNWTAPDAPNSLWSLAVEGDEKDDLLVRSKGGIESNVYGMPVYPYQGLYIGFPWMFDINTYGTGEFAATGDGKIQPQVAVSRNLTQWSRLVRAPIIPLGQAGAWDDGTLYTSTTMQVTDKEMSVYYGAMNLPHGGSTKTQTQFARIAKAGWRIDGLLSLRNEGDDGGVITTKAIIFEGKTMRINTNINNGGSLKVEFLDEDNEPIPGFTKLMALPIHGNKYAATIKWKNGGDLSTLAGKKIKVRFYLTRGDLYSYWFE